ncbi:hypothetical protein DBR06_SOUSAS20510089, partial [Sousa chinensis]
RAPESGLYFLLGNLPIPTISATPGSVIPWNESVKILCGGTPESFLYQLEILGNSTYKVVEKKWGFQKTAEFVIKRMDTNTAGRYQCRYRKQYSWSVHSEALELVVTGPFSGTPASDSFPETLSKPVIWVKPSFMIPEGKLAIIWCQGTHEAAEYQLHFEGGLSAFKRPKSPGMSNRVKFPIPSMTSQTAGQYRCFYRSGELWSEPSDPLDLVVTGDAGDTTFAPTEHTSSDHWDSYMLTTETQFQEDPVLWSHNAQNLLRIGLVFLVLVALVWLPVEDWLHRKKLQERASRASRQECRRFRAQSPGEMTERCSGHR